MRRSVLASLLGITMLTGCASTAAPEPAGTLSSGSPTATDPDAAPATCQRTVPRPELAAQLPAGFPTVTGWQPTELVVQGATRVVRGVLPGKPADLPGVRDRAAEELAGAGYHRTGSDAEAGFEAEADLSGPAEVTITVRPLCRDQVLLSYSVRR